MGCTESKPAKSGSPAKPEKQEPETVPTKESPPAKQEEAPAAAEADAAPVEANEPAAAPAPTPAPAAPVAARPVVSAEPADDGAPLSGRATAKQRVQLTLEKARLRGEINDPAARAFMAHYTALTEGKDGTIPEGLIAPATMIPTYEQLQDVDSIGDALSKTVVLKLNGGLGTSMGLTKAKSLLEVKEGKRFLDLIAAQQNELKKQGDVGFMLMNSYSTSEDTKQALASANLGNWESIQLMQNKVPKITEDFEPAAQSDDELNWCPPGHGDLYAALFGSGRLSELVAEGKEYLFVSNSDNLGATVDLKILKHFAESSDIEFLMEVCERTEADKKGGHLAKQGNNLVLRESAQCPDVDSREFQNISKHRFFNTNNLWIKLPSLKKVMASNGGVMKLPLIRNVKNVDPTDYSSPKVFQLETAMGSAITQFGNNGQALVVPRTRFAPVKTTNDLLVVRSDAYEVSEDSTLRLAAECSGQAPVVDLGSDYKTVQKLDHLTSGYSAIPSLKQCRSMVFTGMAPMKFSPGTSITGETTIDSGAGDNELTLEAGEHSGDVRL